jgi:DNA topoisomerase-1
MVKNTLVNQFPDVFGVGFTAEMESRLDEIESGGADWVGVLKTFYTPFADRLDAVRGNIKDLRAQNQEITDRKCPVCQENFLVVKWSKNGRFLACQGFPTCKYTEPFEKGPVVETDEKCEKCGAPMVVLTMNSSKFLGCSRYPDCKNRKSLSIGVPCPQKGCDGSIVERKTRKGKVFYGCNRYPNCDFASWDKPIDRKCEKCGNPYLIQKDYKRKGATIRCPACKAEIEGNACIRTKKGN